VKNLTIAKIYVLMLCWKFFPPTASEEPDFANMQILYHCKDCSLEINSSEFVQRGKKSLV